MTMANTEITTLPWCQQNSMFRRIQPQPTSLTKTMLAPSSQRASSWPSDATALLKSYEGNLLQRAIQQLRGG
jgi:hypothetical protein